MILDIKRNQAWESRKILSSWEDPAHSKAQSLFHKKWHCSMNMKTHLNLLFNKKVSRAKSCTPANKPWSHRKESGLRSSINIKHHLGLQTNHWGLLSDLFRLCLTKKNLVCVPGRLRHPQTTNAVPHVGTSIMQLVIRCLKSQWRIWLTNIIMRALKFQLVKHLKCSRLGSWMITRCLFHSLGHKLLKVRQGLFSKLL
jgi:hypothetical protein